MLIFQKVSLDDIPKIKSFFIYSKSRACDNTIGGYFMWRDFFRTEYALFRDTLITKAVYFGGRTAFSLPLGPDVTGALHAVRDYCESENIPLVFCTAAEEDIAVYASVFPALEIRYEPDWSDYVYRTEDLVTLSGRRYSGQRNHINYFLRSFPNHGFEVIGDDNLPEVHAFYTAVSAGAKAETPIYREERAKTLEVLENYRDYGLSGGLIRVDGEVVAFAVGEAIKDTLFVHIERANNAYRGAYQMILNAFPKHFATPEIAFINREEDVGDEGLRTAKNALHPAGIIKKHTVTVTG